MAKRGPRSPARGSTTHGAATRDGEDTASATLIDAAIVVVGEQGFAHASARAIAERAGVAPGVIYYHFGSMDDLLVAAHDALSTRRLARIEAAFSSTDRDMWMSRLSSIIRSEIDHPDGIANVELVVGSRTSPALAEAVATNTDTSVRVLEGFVADLLRDTPVAGSIPVDVVAELAAAAFFGMEVMAHVGRDIDVDRIAGPLTAVIAALSVVN